MTNPFDPTTMVEKVRESFANMPGFGGTTLPQMEPTAILSAQKGMLEAVVAANQTLMEGTIALLRRQSEMLQEALQEMTQAAQAMGQTPPAANELFVQQAQAVRQAMAKSVANARELADMATKSYREAFDRVHNQVAAQLDSVKEMWVKDKPNA